MGSTLRSEELRAARASRERREAVRRDARVERRQERLAAARQAIRDDLAPGESAFRAVYLFGTILQPGRFSDRSDVDVDCADPAAESRFWLALEHALLAPMAVLPDFQRRGIGSALVRAGLRACRRLGPPVVFVLGNPDYYPRFGFEPAAASRRFEEVRQVYHKRLAQGGRASGRCVPPDRDPEAPEQTRSRMLAGWGRAGADLIGRLRRWPEPNLDRYRLPHPLLGKLTVREMLFFTLYHDRHHLAIVRERVRG